MRDRFDYPMVGSRSVIRASSSLTATFDRVRHADQRAVADNKRLGAVLAVIRDEQLRRRSDVRSGPGGVISAALVFSRSAELFYSRASECSLGRKHHTLVSDFWCSDRIRAFRKLPPVQAAVSI
jgi:hypothetical protein